MKALSPILYGKRNKSKVFASINSIAIAVMFLFILYNILQSMTNTEYRNSIPKYRNAAEITSYGQDSANDFLIKQINENENIERLISTRFDYTLRITFPGSQDQSVVKPLKKDDVNYFMNKEGIKLVEGRLPKEGTKEIAINKNVAMNRNIKIGDLVGDSINKFDSLPGEYKIVGVLESEAFISIVQANDGDFNSFYAFAKDGKEDSFEKYINSLPKDKLNITTEASAYKHFKSVMGALRVIDIIAILSIVVMVVTVGSSKYAQYYNRKDEFGVLNAIGYNKHFILSKTLKEVSLTNAVGFVIGIVISLIISILMKKFFWNPMGADGCLFTMKGLIVAFFIPMFTILFSIIPINNLINRLDPIRMIEKN